MTMIQVMMAATDDTALAACGRIWLCNGWCIQDPTINMRWKAEKGGGKNDKGGHKTGWLDVMTWDKGGGREGVLIHNNQQIVGAKGHLAKGEDIEYIVDIERVLHY